MNRDTQVTVIIFLSAVVGVMLIICSLVWLIQDTSDTRQAFCEKYNMDYDHSGIADLTCIKTENGRIVEIHKLVENNGKRYLEK